jgi:hypothetical protein
MELAWGPRIAARTDRPIPNIMAVVAVLEIHQEMNAVTAPVEPVEEDGARQDECADEEEHQRVGERGEDILGGSDLKHNAGRSAQ